MKLRGVVLAGGTGSRLRPLTKVTNKHLLPIGRKPMIYYPIEKLIAVGIKEILIVTGVEHMGDVVTLLGSGKDFGCKFTYKVQDEAGGIAQALSLAENFANGQRIAVILGDNIFEANLKRYADRFMKQDAGARLLWPGQAKLRLSTKGGRTSVALPRVARYMAVGLDLARPL